MSKGAGETRKRAWLLTVPAEGEKGVKREELEKALGAYAAYLGQLEEGEEAGYRHWQILLVHEQPVRFSTLHKRLPTAHFEPVRDLAASIKYVQKEETRVPEVAPLVKGEIKAPKGQGHRTDLDELRGRILGGSETVDELLLNEQHAWRHSRMVSDLVSARDRKRWGTDRRDVQVTAIFGDTGTGKTSAALEGLERRGSVCRVTNWNGAGTFDGYDGQPSIIFDEFTGQPPISELLTWLDVYPVSLPARYRPRQAQFSRVVILSNIPPWDWYRQAPLKVRAALARRLSVVEQWEKRNSDVIVTSYTTQEINALMTSPLAPVGLRTGR